MVVALANDGALAGGIDEDDVVQARSAGDGDDLSFGADAREGFFVQAGRIVVAQLADVAGAEAPGLTGNDGGGYLAAGRVDRSE